MRDPFLMLLRKSAGLTEELTPAEYSALLNKEIQTEVTDPQKLISLAITTLKHQGLYRTIIVKIAKSRHL